jgi:hypothetical protein
MTTVAILPVFNANGDKSYRAIAGDRQSVGKTAGQALDGLTTLLGETNFSALLIIQSFNPDELFTTEQQKQLSELMNLWRAARDHGQTLSSKQTELESIVEAELKAATVRTSAKEKIYNHILSKNYKLGE